MSTNYLKVLTERALRAVWHRETAGDAVSSSNERKTMQATNNGTVVAWCTLPRTVALCWTRDLPNFLNAAFVVARSLGPRLLVPARDVDIARRTRLVVAVKNTPASRLRLRDTSFTSFARLNLQQWTWLRDLLKKIWLEYHSERYSKQFYK